MRDISFLFLLIGSLLSSTSVMGQGKVELTSISQISKPLDTLEILPNHVRSRATWLNDTIEIKSLARPITHDVEAIRKYMKDSTYTPTTEKLENLTQIVETAAQNCYSDALQRYFRFNNIDADMLFNKETLLTRKAFENIINSSFVKTGEFSTRKRKHFNDKLADGTLIVFRNKSNWMNHAFYYENGIFYSKNGGSALKEYTKMIDIFKKYWDTQVVEFYEINEAAFSNFLSLPAGMR